MLMTTPTVMFKNYVDQNVYHWNFYDYKEVRDGK